MEENKKTKKGLIILLVLLIIAALSLSVYGYYINNNNDKENNNKNENLEEGLNQYYSEIKKCEKDEYGYIDYSCAKSICEEKMNLENCIVIDDPREGDSIFAGIGIAFIDKGHAYISDNVTQTIKKININEVVSKLTFAYNSSDASKPFILILTDNKTAYYNIIDTQINEDSFEDLYTPLKIETDEEITDIKAEDPCKDCEAGNSKAFVQINNEWYYLDELFIDDEDNYMLKNVKIGKVYSGKYTWEEWKKNQLPKSN